MSESSTKPYLIRAIHEWCTDNGYTPYVAVSVDDKTIVPQAYVKAGEIVLNVSAVATNRLKLGNDLIEFQARFGGIGYELSIPIGNVSAIYARETGHGMAFDVAKPLALAPVPNQDLGGEIQTRAEGASAANKHAAPLRPVVVASSDGAPPSKKPAGGTDKDAGKGASDGPDDNTPKPTRPKLTRVK